MEVNKDYHTDINTVEEDTEECNWLEPLKLAINNAIWMHAPKDLTLGEAERIATDVIIGIVDIMEVVE